jgi:MFS family permease
LSDEPAREYGSRQDIYSESNPGIKTEASPSLRVLLTPQVITVLTVYMVQAVIDMSSQVLLPLMFSTSIPLGGLGFDAYHIGVVTSVFGIANAVVQLMFLGRVIRKFGPRTVHLFSYPAYFLNIALYPLLNYFARRAGKADTKAWIVIVLQLTCRLMNGMSYGMSFFSCGLVSADQIYIQERYK